MKRIVSIILLIILALSSCSHISSQKEQSSSSPGSLDTFDTEQVLNLSEDQKYDIWDYKDNIVLFLVSNLSKQNPSDINDQLTTTYYEAFILYDLLNESIVAELPIEKFGILSSALLAYDGVLFSLFEVTSEKNMESFIYFLNGHEMTSIYQGPYSPFNMGPILYRHDNAVLFSYYDNSENIFGLKKIDSKFNVEPILTFDSEEYDYISDDFRASEAYYGYMVGKDSCVTFYVGHGTETPIKISLPEDRKIHGFDLNEKYLAVSIAEGSSSKTYPPQIEVFDLQTGKLRFVEESISLPLYFISLTDNNKMCGFYFSIFKAFNIDNSITEINLDTSAIQGSFFKIFSDNNQFLIVAYGYDVEPKFWRLSFDT